MKKKELIGNFKDRGTDYRPKGNPQRVNVHDQLFACGLPRGCASPSSWHYSIPTIRKSTSIR